jgi:hypothetical protein
VAQRSRGTPRALHPVGLRIAGAGQGGGGHGRCVAHGWRRTRAGSTGQGHPHHPT